MSMGWWLVGLLGSVSLMTASGCGGEVVSGDGGGTEDAAASDGAVAMDASRSDASGPVDATVPVDAPMAAPDRPTGFFVTGGSSRVGGARLTSVAHVGTPQPVGTTRSATHQLRLGPEVTR